MDRGFDLSDEQQRAALCDPRFADAFLLNYEVPLAFARSYCTTGGVQRFLWLIEAHVAVKSNAVEIAQALLGGDIDRALGSWNSTDIRWPATSMTKTAEGTWQVTGSGGQELTIYPDFLREFLLDLQRFLVNASARAAATMQ